MWSIPKFRLIELDEVGDVSIFSFIDDLKERMREESAIDRFGDELFWLVDETDRRKFLLNFANPEFLSSATLGKLLTLHHKVRAVRGTLVFCNLSSVVQEVFHIMHLDRILTISPLLGHAGRAEILRTHFGVTFRPVPFAPEWRTATAVALARQMSDARDFSAMPILADALQDAGCDNDDVLTHCRGSGRHSRRCSVVELVLGKE